MRRWIVIAMAGLCAACINDPDDTTGQGAEIVVGNTLPSFSVTTSEGRTLSTDMLQGQASVIVFFHTGCPDCQRELPILDTLYTRHRQDQRFTLLCIARAQGKGEILPFWQSHKLEMPFSPQADKAVFELFAQSRIPRIYISDGKCIVRYQHDDRQMPDLPTLEGELADVRATLGD